MEGDFYIYFICVVMYMVLVYLYCTYMYICTIYIYIYVMYKNAHKSTTAGRANGGVCVSE